MTILAYDAYPDKLPDNSRVVSSRSLIREEAVQYIRAITLRLTLIDARPNTRMFVFFGETNVTALCSPVGETAGTPIITNSLGQATIALSIPSGRFNIGTYEILVTDAINLESLNITGSVYGSAIGKFSSTGKIQFYQEKKTTITTVQKIVEVMKQPNLDPLAQSFFTFGVTGGMFLSSIDLFFNTKDDLLPVSVEVRELVNGSPSNLSASNINFVSVMAPSTVRTSDDASLPTTFNFSPPIYLKEDGEFCFVVRSNSKNYNIFTSAMGETSFENGAKIFENPYVGSLFKSENNITWTAFQNEDIKFTMKKAVFDTAGGTVNFAAAVPPVFAYGTNFRTVSGSTTVTYTSNFEHGLETDSKIEIIAVTYGIYNGIPGTEFNGTHTVTVIDRNTLTFDVTTPATSTGTITTSNVVTKVQIDSGGSGYTSSDIISFSGGNGTGATATLLLNSDGTIVGVTIIDEGSGYTTPPDISISTSTGSGAELTAIVTPVFTIFQNKPLTAIAPKLHITNYGTSSTVNTLNTTIGNYSGGNLTTYSSGKSYQFKEFSPFIPLYQNSLICSEINEQFITTDKSTTISIDLKTDNPNVSPIINLKERNELIAYSSRINNQPYDDRTSTNSYGVVTGFTQLVGGSNYTITPTVTIDPPYYPWGIQATATATLTAGVVTSLTLTQAGTGYIEPPNVVIVRATGDTTGAGASVQTTINSFNSELLPNGGLAKSRYLTKKFKLKTISNGIRLISTISSGPDSSVDWYIRTSLSSSGVSHEEQQWQLLSCDVERNKSSYEGDLIDYEFKADYINSFDTYDLKCVLLSSDPTKSPFVTNYRAVVLA